MPQFLSWILNLDFCYKRECSTKTNTQVFFSESISAQLAYDEKYIDAARRRINDELGLILEEHDASSSSRLTQVCKMSIDVKDEDYNYGFPGSILSNSWRSNAFVTIYECILDHDGIDRMSINPYEMG